MKNLPILNLTTDVSLYVTPIEGNLENIYKPLRNIQTDSGGIVDFNTDKIKFDSAHPLLIETQPSYDGSVNLIINDDKNPPLLINTRFSVEEDDTYIIPDHSGSNDTNLYSESNLELDIRLYKTITKIPKLEYLGLDYNGKMKCGNYNFYFKYSDVDGNETDFISESGLVTCHIGNINDPYSIRMGMENEDSKKSIKFKLSNIDTQYDLIRIYYTKTTSDNSSQPLTTAHYIDNKYVINGDSLELLITGFENHFDISINDINPIYELADSVKAQAQCQNRLFFGNINKPKIEYTELSDLSLRIIPNTIQNYNIGNLDYNYIDKSGKNLWEYYNTKNIYNYLGYWSEEYYRFGIVYILNDYTLSPVFNVRGLDLSLQELTTSFPVKDDNLKRVYVSYDSNGYIINKKNLFENIKGVIKLPKKEVIKSDGVYPLGIKFTFESGVIDELKKYTKGFFFVRQKRIPTILAQGCTIGKTKNPYGNIPILPVNGKGVSEGFLTNNGQDIEKDSNSFLIKSWKWRYPKYYLNNLNGLIATNIDDELSETSINHPLNWKLPSNSKLNEFNKNLYVDGDRVKSKYRTSDRIGDPIFGYWDLAGDDDDVVTKLKSTFGNTFRILSPKKLLIDSNNYEIKAGIFPEVELREALFNQIFTSNKFIITNSASQSINKIEQGLNSSKHYYLVQNTNSASYLKSSIVTMVNDGMQLTTNGSDLFSARAGEAEEVWKIVDIKNNWELQTDKNLIVDEINTKLTNNTDYVRGMFGTYVGLGEVSLNPGEIINIRPEDYSESNIYKENAFNSRFVSFEPYFAISDRIDINNSTNNITCYRGDCFVGNFTHRMHRNFIDPDLPTNDKIVDPYTWYKGFAVKQEAVNYDIEDNDNSEINRILLDFKRNNKGKILEPGDSKYLSAGSLQSALTGLDSYAISGATIINRADVNAVKLGHWFTFKVMSNINISMRDIDLSNPSEQSIFGKPRGFFPFNKMSVDGTCKIPDSNIINGSAGNTLSNRYNFIIPDVPYIKNKFGTRIQYSDISVNDAFRNGYRIFRGGNYKDIPKTYGSLTSLKELSGNLIAVMENGVLLIPVNERVVSGQGDGGEVFINTANILPENPRVLSSNFGSIWKESVLETINTVYGIDTNAKKIWKTDGTSFTILSDLKVQKFLNNNINLSEFDKSIQLGVRNVKTHYNAFKGDIMFTFYNKDKIWNLCYNEKLDKFITLYSWIPSFSENVHGIYLSFDVADFNNFIDYNLLSEDGDILDFENGDDVESEIGEFDNTCYIWKHGQAGNYDLQEPILPTKWYDKQEVFEFEFVTKDPPITQKIFDNLKIISNKSKPKEFEFEIVGEGYEWFNYKDEIQFINNRVTDIYSLEDSYKDFLIANPSIKKLPFIKRVRYDDNLKWDGNTTEVTLVHDDLLSEDRIHLNQLGNDIKSVGRVKGNMQYLEDLWNIEIRPINFKYAYLENNILKFTTLKQSKIRDKYLKIKVRYSGEDLTIVQAIKTLFTISYA